MKTNFNLCLFSIGIITIFHLVSADLDKSVNDPCKNDDGTAGICTLDTECPAAVAAVKLTRHHNFQQCGFEGIIQIVCCPVNVKQKIKNSTTVGRISEKYCDNFYKDVPAPVEFQINEGENAARGEFPHMVALGVEVEQDKVYNFVCGGTLISDRFIVTAAHCVVPKSNKQKIKIARMGALIVPESIDTINSTIDVIIKAIHIHPNYTSKEKYNDIALLELEKNVTFSDDLRPACLYQKDNNNVTNQFWILGWGKTDSNQNRLSNLQKALVNLYNNTECVDKLLKLESNLSLKNEQQFCTYHERSNTCEGDSGGPLIIFKNTYPVIVGVASFGGNICSNDYPTVYIKIQKYLDWIESFVWPNPPFD